MPAETGEALTAQARDATQLLVAGLFTLPVEKTNDGPVITLPAATTALPRAKPVPQPYVLPISSSAGVIGTHERTHATSATAANTPPRAP